MSRHTDIEMRWVEAWNAVYDISKDQENMPCRLPNGVVVTINECLGWIQDTIYSGSQLKIEYGWADHRKGIVVNQTTQDQK